MIDETMVAYIILIIGIILLVIEAAAPGNFIIVPATILTIVGAVFAVFPDYLFTIYSPILAIIAAVIGSIIAIQLYKRMSPVAPPETLVGTSLIGRTGVVTTMITPNTMLGKVRIDGETWSAESDSCIPAGTPIKVIASEGVHVTVEEISQEDYEKSNCNKNKCACPQTASKEDLKKSASQNETAVVITLISPGLGTGKVKIGEDVFNATADCNIYAGTTVKIVSKDKDGTVHVEE